MEPLNKLVQDIGAEELVLSTESEIEAVTIAECVAKLITKKMC